MDFSSNEDDKSRYNIMADRKNNHKCRQKQRMKAWTRHFKIVNSQKRKQVKPLT